jgi:hypothetical protein
VFLAQACRGAGLRATRKLIWLLPRHGLPHFISPAEEMEGLRDYLEALKKEMAGVEARIHELKGT